MSNVNTEPRSIMMGVRVTPEQRNRLIEIAKERGFLGGPGLPPGTPNVSLAVRWLLGQGDRVIRENDVVLDWDRNP